MASPMVRIMISAPWDQALLELWPVAERDAMSDSHPESLGCRGNQVQPKMGERSELFEVYMLFSFGKMNDDRPEYLIVLTNLA